MKTGRSAYFDNHYAENIIFIGSKYNKYPLSQFRDNIIEGLFNEYPEFKIYGNSWDIKYNAKPCTFAESNNTYNRTKINISISYMFLFLVPTIIAY
jgi:hypothetical protein